MLTERSSRGSEREADVECGQVVSKQQDPRSDEVVQGHSQRHLLPAKDTFKPHRNLLHQELVSHQTFTVLYSFRLDCTP